MTAATHISVRGLTLAYDERVILKDLTFEVGRGDIFIIMGGSGCGKSTLLRAMVGLLRPAQGDVLYEGAGFWRADEDERSAFLRRFGILYQAGALWSSMTLAENISVPLSQFTTLTPRDIRELASFKLALVGLAGFEDYYPADISGGMRKRAGLARAIALDPEILYFDEPSAGLDPISSRLLDDLIRELSESQRATIVMVTHELASIFAIGTHSVFLDGTEKTMIASGPPKQLLEECDHPTVREFLTRGVAPAREIRNPGAGAGP